MTHDRSTSTYDPPADPIDAAAEEFVARFRKGEHPQVDEYADRYPEFAADIRKLFPMLVALEECGSTVDMPGGGIASVSRRAGERVGGYTLGRRIGEGGMGVVFEAVQEPLGRPVALKFLKRLGADPLARERFLREAQAVARLHHPNIVTVYGGGEHDGLPYYAMQLVRGHGLDTHIGDHKATPPTPDAIRRAVEQATQVADALAYAHRQGVVHRDIKPSNLLVDDAGRVWVADFGLARIDGDVHLTATGGIVGTRQYMAPEQYDGWSDPRSDVYALGVTLYELTTAAPAFDGQTPQEVLRKVMQAAVVPPRKRNPHVHPDLETVILKAMAAEPAHRYQTAAALADDLRRFADGRPVSARRLSSARKVARWVRRNPVAGGLAAAVVLLMTAVTVMSAWAALRFNRLKNEADTARHTIEQQRDTIGRQLDENQQAEVKSREQLSRFLLRSAQAEMAGRSGGKREALAALGEAADLSRRLNLPAEYRNTLRREYIAALARTDLAVGPDRKWSIPGFTNDSPLAFCPDGTLFAVSVEPGVVSVRTADANEEKRRLTGPAGDTAVGVTTWLRFNRTHKHLAGLHGRTLRVWDVADGRLAHQFGPAVGGTFDFHPDESALAWVDNKNRVRVRNLTTGAEQFFKPLAFRPTWLRYDPTGRRLAVCGQGERAVHILNLDAEVWSACPLPTYTDRVAWAPDGVRLAAASTATSDAYVVSRLNPTAAPVVIRGHVGRVVQLAFHPTEEVLATAAWDQTVRAWDLTRPEAPELAVRKAFSLSYRSLEFSADGSQLGMGVAGNRLWVWEWMRPTAGELVLSSRWGRLWGAALSPDESTVVGLGERGMEAWDLARPQQPIAAFPVSPQSANELPALAAFGVTQLKGPPVSAVAGRRVRFTADGRELLIGAGGGTTRATIQTDPPGSFRLTDAVTRRELGGYEHSWSNDGTLMAVVPDRGKIAVYDTTTHEQVVAVPRYGSSGYAAISPDNRWLATGSWPQPGVNVWDIRTGGQVGNTLPTSNSGHPTFSPDGRWLVVGSGDGYQFYHTDGWKPAHRVPRTDCGHFPGPAAFTPDGKTVAVWTRPGHVSLIDSADGSELAVLPITVRSDSIDALGELRFTPDGRKLVVVADARRIQVWDLAALRKQLAAVDLDWATRPD